MVRYFRFFLPTIPSLARPISARENFYQIKKETRQLHQAVSILRDDFNQPKDLHVVPYEKQVIASLTQYYEKEMAIDQCLRKFSEQDSQMPLKMRRQFIEDSYKELQRLNSKIIKLCNALSRFYLHQEARANNSLPIGHPDVAKCIEENSKIFKEMRDRIEDIKQQAQKEIDLLGTHKENALSYIPSLSNSA